MVFISNLRYNNSLFLERVEIAGICPTRTRITCFFSDPKSVTSEERIALLSTLTRLWMLAKSSRGGKWQKKKNHDAVCVLEVCWREERASWEALAGDGKNPSQGRARRKMRRVTDCVVNKSLSTNHFVWQLAMMFDFAPRILKV